ncbi:Uncharacterised protein [Nocardia farcinica]|uniref:Uncharacterized protein n=1 Tax=Nocardia farcinica TaxID=37329 RepID=A0A449H9M0_NOCFR|nr:Uncharacterised protein [Nocardia farcinica]
MRARSTRPEDMNCRGCGLPIVEFVADYGLTTQLDGNQLPIDTDLRALRQQGRSVWVLNPETGCWTYKFGFIRDWRDTREIHRCTPRA